MAVHHKHPRKLYNTLAGDMSTSGGRDGFSEFTDDYDFLTEFRKARQEIPGLTKRIVEITGIKRKRLSEIVRMVGDEPTRGEMSAIRYGYRILKRENKRNKNKDR